MSRLALAAATAALTACQSMAVPAVLTSSDPDNMAHLKAALATAMGQAHVELGPGDPTLSPTLSVLPRPPGPPEDRSLAMPTIFKLETEGGACFVVRVADGTRTRVDGAQCKPA